MPAQARHFSQNNMECIIYSFKCEQGRFTITKHEKPLQNGIVSVYYAFRYNNIKCDTVTGTQPNLKAFFDFVIECIEQIGDTYRS